jgi:FdhE protein
LNQGRNIPRAGPEPIAPDAGAQASYLRLPEPDGLFDRRQRRLRSLAPGHAMGEFLMFVATLATAQHRASRLIKGLEAPDTERLSDSAKPGVPLLAASNWARDRAWLEALHAILDELESELPDSAVRERVRRLANRSGQYFEVQADRMLTALTPGPDQAETPLIAAALQVYWARLVAAAGRAHGASLFPACKNAGLCPCCGFRPTASIVGIGGDTAGVRYLHCALCSAQWRMAAIQCSHCGSTNGMHYLPPNADLGGEGARPLSVTAEYCDACHRYLKVLSMDADPDVEAVADDLATVALDLLATKSGNSAGGVNLMLLYGDGGDA